ncbi:hypothetical protein JG688_00012099 [Phytophthora aleatoria]|uniref:Uncharacterized protein n=1 Tax=Phytophthora aleatoria TaxID=2496075 RepID=A0A8J5IBU7_9STRA|nr:hypothetical protein JG688_00012099 [Phytophthora aleatoria]
MHPSMPRSRRSRSSKRSGCGFKTGPLTPPISTRSKMCGPFWPGKCTAMESSTVPFKTSLLP